MALYISAWDLPDDPELLKQYNVKAKDWVAMILRQPGVKEFRAYRDPLMNTPSVMIHIEFDSLESIVRYLKTNDFSQAYAEMSALGCMNFTNEMWDGSPLIPEPLKP